MKIDKEALQREMLERIKEGGAWFTTRKDKYIRIAYSDADACYFARECFIKGRGLEGGAYSFGTDWFDINFHGRYIDIYVDPETFRRWPVSYDPARGTRYEGADECVGMAERVLRFCRQADMEALAGISSAFRIDGAHFDEIIDLNEKDGSHE